MILSGILSPALFTFLRSLARNNDRDWFEANKQRYIDDVRDPLCAFVEAVGPKLRTRWKKARKIGLDEVPMLKRPPRGFDADHPFLEDLKRKSFTTRTPFTEKQACAGDFPARFAKTCRSYKPLVDFLSESLAGSTF
jgi:uncharacterized protein (DUF2461 family)